MLEREALSLEMLQFLEKTRPNSSSSALAELRKAFPKTNLCDRVRVCRNWHDDATPVSGRVTGNHPSH